MSAAGTGATATGFASWPLDCSHVSMLLLTSAQIDRVHDVTDSLGLKRLAIVVPLPAADRPIETVMPDGTVLISAPFGARFDSWCAGLPQRLAALDLRRTPRADQLEPHMPRVVPALQASGMRRYWDWSAPSTRPTTEDVAAIPPMQDPHDESAMDEFAHAESLENDELLRSM